MSGSGASARDRTNAPPSTARLAERAARSRRAHAARHHSTRLARSTSAASGARLETDRHEQVILEVLADARAARGADRRRPHAARRPGRCPTAEQVRRADRTAREDDLATFDHLLAAARRVRARRSRDRRRARGRARARRVITVRLSRRAHRIEKRRRRARAMPVADRVLVEARALLLGAVEVVVDRHLAVRGGRPRRTPAQTGDGARVARRAAARRRRDTRTRRARCPRSCLKYGSTSA